MKTRKCIRSLFRFVPLSLLLIVALCFGSQACHAFQNQEGNGEQILLAASTVAGPGSAPVTKGPAVKANRARRSILSDADGDGLSDGLQARLAGMRPDDPIDVVVTFREKGSVGVLQKSVGPFKVKREFKIIPAFAATIKAAQARGLAKAAGVFRVEEDFRVSIMLDAANRDFGTEAARFDFAVSGSGIGICVVDTGVDPNHEQLFDEQNNRSRVVDFVDYVNGRTESYDDHFHGTHVASIAAGDGTGGADAATFQGVAPAAAVYAAKVLDSLGQGTESAVIDGVEWCSAPARGIVGPGVHIVSLSLGSVGSSDGQDALSQAVNNAVAAGKIAVIAAGNSGDGESTVGSPGGAAQAVTVGAAAEWSAAAVTANHSAGVYLAPFSSRGPTADGRIKPDIVAPGVSITAANFNTGNGYATYSGTSMATPFVSGAVALALERDPSLTPASVKSMLVSTAHDRGPAGPDNDWGSGLLDGYAFVASGWEGSGSNAFPKYQRTTGSVPTNGEETFTFDVAEDGLGIPAAVTLTITDGTAVCLFGSPILCDFLGLGWAWSPDLDAELIHPDGSVIASSICPLTGECGSMGRQETLHYLPSDPQKDIGTYTVRVYPFADDAEGAKGGVVALGISTGPLPAASANNPPVATDDSYGMEQDATLTVPAPGVLDNDSDVDVDTLTTILASPPVDGALVLDPDGAFTYTPAQGYSGTDSFAYKAHDGADESNLATVAITVAAVNQAPVADDQDVTTAEDTSLTIILTASDVDGDPLTYAVVNGPANGTLSGAAPMVTYTPAQDFNGADSFTYKANDTLLDSNISTATITVDPANDAPTTSDGALSTSQDVAKAGTLVGNDIDGDALIYSIVVNGTNGTAVIDNAATGAYTYTPNDSNVGPDSITFKVNDGSVDSNVSTITINVSNTNDAPVANADAFSTDEDVAYAGSLSASDADLDTLTYSVVAQGSKGTVVITDVNTGAFTYTPIGDANGADSFTFKANDGIADSNTATVTVTINPINDAPVTTADAITATEDVTYNGTLPVATDVDGDALTYALVADATNGAVTVNADGTYSYVPTGDYNGADSFTYKANDGTADSNLATVNITVTPVNEPPVADQVTIDLVEYKDKAKQLLVEATSSAQPTAILTLSFDDGSLEGFSAVMSYSAADAKYVYRNKAPKPLDDRVTVTSDLDGSDTVTLGGTNAPPEANDDAFTASANSSDNSLDVLVNDSDPDGDSLSITFVDNSASHGGTVTSNLTSDRVLYTPAADFAGPETFTYTVNDGRGGIDTATVTVTVGSGGNASPTAAPDYETIPKNSSVFIDLVANDSDSDGNIDPKTIVIESAPIRGSTVDTNPDGTVTYIPKKNFVGTDTFTYTVKDNEGALSNETTVSVIVNR